MGIPAPASECSKSDGGSPILNKFDGSMRDSILHHHDGMPKHLGCSCSPRLPASSSELH